MTQSVKNNLNIKKTVDDYLKKVGGYLPISENQKKSVLSEVREDVIDALQQSGKKRADPVKEFGDPYQVAKDIGMAHEWKDQHASFMRRFGAYIVDTLIIWVIIIAVWVLPPIIDKGITDLPLYLGIFIFQLIVTGFLIYPYYMVFEWRCSTTPGKKLLGLTVCDISGVRITGKQAIIRNLSKEKFLFWDWLIAMIVKKPNVLRIMDHVAKTIVIRN